MNNIASQRKASRRKGCRRNRKNQMGGAGEAYTLGGHVAGSPIVNNYGQEIVRFPSCEGGIRPGYIQDASIKGGLPGFSGGRRRLKGGRGGVLETGAAQLASQGQMGGTYTFAPVTDVKNPFMEAGYSGCGQGREAITNPYSGGVDLKTLITAPAPIVQNPSPMKGGKQSGGVGGVDSMFYNAPRAGWSTWPSNAQGGDAGTLADGKTPFLINVPFSAQPTPSQACLKTGGRRKMRKTRKARKARKTRKMTKRR